MFILDHEKYAECDCQHTVSEIIQQTQLWKKAFLNYNEKKDALSAFLKSVREKHPHHRIIFTGAGTSEYIGNIIVAFLNRYATGHFESIATTDLVSAPHLYFKKDVPTLLVSFARSGNSPESLAAVTCGKKIVTDFYNLAITCAPDGALATQLHDDPQAYTLIMPEGSNDRAFAMTSSMSCMLLSALCVFDDHHPDKSALIDALIRAGEDVIARSDEITAIAMTPFSRIVYLGSGALYPLTNECRLKILELTAGKIVTLHESSMGFRHGPKSFIDENTLVIGLLSPDAYTRQYDEDILKEIQADGIARQVWAVSPADTELPDHFLIHHAEDLPDVYLALIDVMIAQIIALTASLRIGNTPDHPSRTGTVNRVVKGVTIHEL